MIKIDNKISTLLKIEKDLSEPIQGQYYSGTENSNRILISLRITSSKLMEDLWDKDHYTVMIYLNSTEEGGETTFPLINKEFPSEGKAIIWSI